MQVADGKSVVNIIRKSLNLVDTRLIDHGQRVAYILYKMLQYTGQYSLKQMIDICTLGIFHDIGAYKTEEIDKMMEFETTDILQHSIYGYLFIKHLSPLNEFADIVLYHHYDYCKMNTVSIKNKKFALLLHLADRIDFYMQTHDNKIADTFFDRYRDKKFASADIDFFLQANKKYKIAQNMENGNFLNELLQAVEGAQLSRFEIDQYLKMLAYSIDFRSEHTVEHTITTVGISVEIAKQLGLNEQQVEKIYYGALLHDLGKISTPLAILESSGKLSPEQMTIMKEHVKITDAIIRGSVDDEICNIAVRHHEKIDGTGYPLGLKGESLSVSERVVAVADIVSALSGRRSYKEVFEKQRIIEILQSMSQSQKICPFVSGMLINHYDEIMKNVNENYGQALNTYHDINFEFKELYDSFAKAEHKMPYSLAK